MRRIYIMLAAIVLVGAGVNIQSVDAHEHAEILTQKSKERLTDAVCKRVEGKIANRTTRFDDNKARHVRQYTAAKERFVTTANRLEKKGYDVTKLREDAKVLDAKITTFANDYATYIAKLRETQGFACGQSEGKFRDTLKEARDLLQIVHNDARAIHEYYKNTIRPDIEALRKQTPTPTATTQ